MYIYNGALTRAGARDTRQFAPPDKAYLPWGSSGVLLRLFHHEKENVCCISRIFDCGVIYVLDFHLVYWVGFGAVMAFKTHL